MPRRYHGSRSGSTNVRRTDRASERVVGQALAVLDSLYAAASLQGGARQGAASVLAAATRATSALRASRARAAADLAARVDRLEAVVRRSPGR